MESLGNAVAFFRKVKIRKKGKGKWRKIIVKGNKQEALRQLYYWKYQGYKTNQEPIYNLYKRYWFFYIHSYKKRKKIKQSFY